MGAAKILWEIELEQTGESLEKGEITREEVIKSWVRLGLDREEAENWADAAQGLM